jgi:hypothetical protein
LPKGGGETYIMDVRSMLCCRCHDYLIIMTRNGPCCNEDEHGTM